MTVYSSEPDLLRPVLSATPRVNAVYRKPEEYRPDDQGLVILDRFIPQRRPAADSIWIDPPAIGSPIPVRKVVEQAAFKQWTPGHPASAGLRAKDFKLEKATVFEPATDDGRIGEVEAGPVIVARPSKPKIVVFGFHPALSAMRYELTTPLLFANLLRWISPEIFRRWEISGGSVGSIRLAMDQDTPAESGQSDGGGRHASAVHPARPHARFLLRHARLGARGRGRSRVRVLADAAAALGQQVGAARRGGKGHSALRAGPRRLERHLAVAGGARAVWDWLWSGCCTAASGAARFAFGRCCCGGNPPPPRRRVDDVRSSAGAAAGACCPVLWAAWEWRSSARRLALLLKAGAFAAIALALGRAAAQRLRKQGRRGDARRHLVQHLRAGSADRVGLRRQARARARTPLDARSSRSPAPRASPRPTSASRATGNCITPPPPRATAPTSNRPSAMAPPRCRPAWSRACCSSPTATRISGSVSRAIWQAQQLGVPIDTVPLAGRPKPGLVLESVALPGAGIQRRAFPDRSHPGIAARREGHRRDDGGRQGDRQQPRRSRRRREPSALAGQRQFGRRDRAGRQSRRARARRGAFRGRRHAAQPARAAALARSVRQRAAPDPRAAGEPVRSGARHRRHSRQARQLPARRHQQLGHGEHSRCRAKPRSRISSSRAAGWSGSPASTTSTSTRRARKRTRWSARCPRKWRRRARPRAPPWC